MKSIIELCELVSPLKVRHLKLIDEDEDQAGQLYHLIREKKVTTDEEAIEMLFPGKTYGKIYLNGIKDKLSQRLQNTLLFLDQNQQTDYRKAFITAYRQFLVYKILSFSRKRKAARDVAKKAVKIAVKFHFLEIVIPFSRELKIYYSTVEPNKNQFKKYREIQYRCQDILEKEMEVEDMFCQLALLQTKKQYRKQELTEMKELAQKAEEAINNYSTYWLLYLAGNIIVIWHQMNNDHRAVTRICDIMLDKLQELPYEVPTPAIFGFTFKKIPGHIINREFEAAERVLQECLKMFSPGQINWGKSMQFKAIIHFHKGEYQEALEVAELVKNKHKNTLPDQETWQLYEAYGKILTGRKLRLGRMLNETPQYSKDKRGMNINILIIRVLEYSRREKFDKVIDSAAALKQYAYRYLRQDETFRSNCFIRMLLSLEKGHFNQVGVNRHAREYVAKLRSMPIQESKQDYEVEIVPYEALWGYLMELLPKKP